MTNFSGIGRKEFWSWLTPERAVLVGPVFAGLGLSLALFGFGVAPLTLRVREQSEIVAELQSKADFVPVLLQQFAELKRKQTERDQQLDRLLALVAGMSELQTFLARLNDMARLNNVEITTTKPGDVERYMAEKPTQTQDAPPAAEGGDVQEIADDPLLNRGLERRSAELTVTGSFEQVLAFLQSLELLETFVVISDMNIQEQSLRSENGFERSKVAMDLTLSAYGRQPNAVSQLKAMDN